MVVAAIVVILTWIGCLAIIKWIWTLLKCRFSNMVENSQDNHELAAASLPPMATIGGTASSVSSEMGSAVVRCVATGPVASCSSASSVVEWKYDVFLSFRGPDTRMSITYELYDRLQNKRGIKTFMDDQDLEVGDPISPTLLTAIEESRFAIVVLSPKYASSTWCLQELEKICDCMKDHNRVLPVFYGVDPTDVRLQKRSFKDAFTYHEMSGRHTSVKVQQWRDALNKVASFSGWHTNNFKTDRELVDSIVEFVCGKVQPIEIELTMATRDFQAFEETRKAMNDVMKALQDDEVTALGVYGMGGVGKTTMVKHVGAEACRKSLFDHVIVVVVSQNPHLKKIQQKFAEQLDFNFQEKLTESGRASRLYQQIMRKNNILIILDDIWKFIDLSTIGLPSYDELKKCNSKVLFTTRRLHVCNSMGSQASIPLNILSKEDSWSLFVRNTRRPFESAKFYNVARKVAGECRGLPIALIAVARAVRDKELVEWEKAARRLEKSQSATLDDEHDAFECIKLSYDYLKGEDSKSCFLLCCLFPEDNNIPLEHLFRYAIGKGLFQDTETIYEARGAAISTVKYLKDSSLLLEVRGSEGFVRMHDVVRDTAINIAKSEQGQGFLVKTLDRLEHWHYELHDGFSAISLMGTSTRKLPEQLVCPKLQILLLNVCWLKKIPESLFQSPNDLRVIDLSHNLFPVLPQSFGLLTNLRILCLHDCHNLIDISMVGKLRKLEILSMRNTSLEELCREIGNLNNLRVLDITGGSIDRIPSKLIPKLHNLEELYLNYVFCDWGRNIDGEGAETNADFDEITSLSKLRVLTVKISDEDCIPRVGKLNSNWDKFCICIGENAELEVEADLNLVKRTD